MSSSTSTTDPDASAWGKIGAHVSWAKTEDRTARTAPARAALTQKFLDEAGGDPVRAEHLRRAHFQRMALKSAQSRRKTRALSAEAAATGSGTGGANDAA